MKGCTSSQPNCGGLVLIRATVLTIEMRESSRLQTRHADIRSTLFRANDTHKPIIKQFKAVPLARDWILVMCIAFSWRTPCSTRKTTPELQKITQGGRGFRHAIVSGNNVALTIEKATTRTAGETVYSTAERWQQTSLERETESVHCLQTGGYYPVQPGRTCL